MQHAFRHTKITERKGKGKEKKLGEKIKDKAVSITRGLLIRKPPP